MDEHSYTVHLEHGRLTVPDTVLAALGVGRDGCLTFALSEAGVSVSRSTEDESAGCVGEIYVDPVDGFVFGPGSLERMRRAREDAAAGRTFTLSERQLRGIFGDLDE